MKPRNDTNGRDVTNVVRSFSNLGPDNYSNSDDINYSDENWKRNTEAEDRVLEERPFSLRHAIKSPSSSASLANNGTKEHNVSNELMNSENLTKLRCDTRPPTSSRKMLEEDSNDSDEGASSRSSANSSSEVNPDRSSSGYEGGKSGSNGGSSDSFSASGQGNSGSGSDDGYYNDVTLSEIPNNKNGNLVDEVEYGSPSPSSDCSSTGDISVSDLAAPSMARILASKSGNDRPKSGNHSSTSFTITTSETVSETLSNIPASSSATGDNKQHDSNDSNGINKINVNKSDHSIKCNGDIIMNNNSRTATHKPPSPLPRARGRPLRQAPYYYYIDHSRDIDEDPATPLSQPLYVPSFAAKMHAILIREELHDIVCWMPHGRSWKITNPKEFELRILPLYFNHTKIASFYRQANGWGFRRMLKGSDKGSFYNENFLRGLPHLSKKMSRTGGVKIVDDTKLDTNVAHEPNLWMISEEHPLPERLEVGSLNYLALNAINECILDGGPKARMPVLKGLKLVQPYRPASAPPAAKREYNQGNSSRDLESSEQSSQMRMPQIHSPLPHQHSQKPAMDIATRKSRSMIDSSTSASPSFSISSANTAICGGLLVNNHQSQMNNFRAALPSVTGNTPQQSQIHQGANDQNDAAHRQLSFFLQQVREQQECFRQPQQQPQQQPRPWSNAAQRNHIATMLSCQYPTTNPNPLHHLFMNQVPNGSAEPLTTMLTQHRHSQQKQQQHQGARTSSSTSSPAISGFATAFASNESPTLQQQHHHHYHEQQELPHVHAKNATTGDTAQSNNLEQVLSALLSASYNNQTIFAPRTTFQQIRHNPQSTLTPTNQLHAPYQHHQQHNQKHYQQQQEQQDEQEQQNEKQEQQQKEAHRASPIAPNMPAAALRDLVAQAILLGARFGAESVMNQNSSSSDSGGNQDDSSNTI